MAHLSNAVFHVNAAPYPLDPKAVWAQTQTRFDSDAINDWLSDGESSRYDWGSVEVLEDHPYWKAINAAYVRDLPQLTLVLERAAREGEITKIKTHGGGGTWASNAVYNKINQPL